MMSREHHRRRSPESSRRRRKERRDSREQLQSQHIPTSIPPYQDSFQQPQYQQPFQQPQYQQPYQQPPYQEPYQESHRVPYQPEPSEVRDRAFSTSSSSSSTSSSLLNISQPSKKFGIGTFFSGSARKHHRRVRKKRSRFLRLGNSSSSSVGSDLAYGKGYIDRRRSREFSPPSGQRPPRRNSQQERPRPPKRAQTDEEIIELGRKFAEIARQQNTEDLRASGRTRPSTLVGAATALSQFRRTNSGNLSRGIGNSKPHRDSSPDDSDWESASSHDESSDDVDYGLAYGSSHHLPGNVGRPSHLDASIQSAQTYSHDIPLNRKPSLVDPKLFGPVNSLRGIVHTPCGFDRVDRNTVSDARHHYDPSIAPSETVVSSESRPLQHVYAVPTSDPSRFDAGRGSVVSAHQDAASSFRPDPVPIQQPKPITRVHTKVFESVDTDPRYSKGSLTGSALAQTAGAGLAGVAVGATLSSDAAIGELLRSAQKENRVKYEDTRADDAKHQSKRSGDEVYDGKYEKSNDRDVLRDVPSEKRRESKPAIIRDDGKERRRREKRESGSDRDLERERRRRDKYRDDIDRTEKAERRESDSRDGQKASRKESHREEYPADQFTSRDKYRDDLDRTVKVERRKDDLRDDQKVSRKESRREEGGEDQSITRGPKIDIPALSERPGFVQSEGAIDPFQYQVADDAFPTPRYGTPKRPLTPIVMTVEREPDFSSFEPHERLSRKDSFERELQDAHRAYEAAGQATVPVSKADFEIAEDRQERSSKRDSSSLDRSQHPSSSPQPKDPVLSDADRAYREARLARRIREQEERSRSNSPDGSVVDKWKDDKDSATSQIITPPAMDHPKQKSPYDGPDADVRIDNVLEHPKELSRFRILGSRHRASTISVFSARDPSAERERPVLNIVRPTPAPSPAPEKQQSKTADVSSPITRVDTDSVSIGARGEVVSAPSTPTYKVVSWGENQTKHYVVESPEREDDPYSGAKVITLARSRTGKKGGGWGAVAAAAISGVGVGVAASSASDSAVDINATRRQDEPDNHERSSKRKSSLQFDALYDDPPIPGPKPPSPRSFQMPGGFAEDPAFMANIAAGLEGSGFDPNIIINDANFHRRDSPPGSNELFGPSAAATSRASSLNGQNGSDTGFVIGELPDTPADERERSLDNSKISSKPSKREMRKQEKAASKDTFNKSVLVINDDPTTERSHSVLEEDWSAPVSQLSKKEQKRRDKAAKAQAWEDDKVPEDSLSVEQEPEPVIDEWEEWEDMPSKKKKSKKSKKAIVIQQDSTQGQHDPQQAVNVETSEFSVPVDAYRDLQDIKVVGPEYNWTMEKDTQGNEGTRTIHDFDANLASTSSGSKPIADDFTTSAPEDEWSAPSKDKKKKKKAKRDIVTEDPLPSLIPASELSRESSYNIVEPEVDSVPVDEWDLPRKSNKNKRNSTGDGSLPRSTEVFEAPEEPIKSHTAGEASESATRDDYVDDGDHLKKSGRSKRDPSPSHHVSVTEDIVESPKDIGDSFSDLRSEKTAATEEDWDLPKKSKKKKKKSKRDSTTYEEFPSRSASQSAAPSETSTEGSKKKSKGGSSTDSPSRSAPTSELRFEGDEKRTRKEKRRSAPGEFPDEDDFLNEGEPPDRERERFKFEDNDVSSVVSDPNRYDGHRSSRSRGRADDFDDAKSVASAPDGASRKNSKSSKDKRESGSSSLFDRFKSSIGISEGKEQSRKEANDKNSFLDNAGTLGASAGLMGAAIALAFPKSPDNATDTPPEIGSSREMESLERLPSPSSQPEFIDPEIVEREIRPAIDPTYGDLLPLPPSRSGSPVPALDDSIPPLPESRPGTPEDQRERLLLTNKPTHTRRRSDTPLRVKTPSHSAIPIQFRLGQRTTPASPGIVKPSPVASPITGTPEAGGASKARPRPMSWESTRAFKPLLLVEKTSRELVVTPTSRHEELYPSDIPDDFYANPGYTPTSLDELHDDRLTQEAQHAESPQLPPLRPVEEPQSPTPNPDPVDPVSKNRSSYLLYSSPSATQNSRGASTSEGSPTLGSTKEQTALDELKEDVPEDTPSGDLLGAAAAGLATDALIASALVGDHADSQDVAVDTKDGIISDVMPLDEPTGLGERTGTKETGVKEIEPDEFSFAPGKKSKKGKKGKNKSREIEQVAEASTSAEAPTSGETLTGAKASTGAEAPTDWEDAPSGGTPESAVKTDQKDDDFAPVKLSKKDKKKKKKGQNWEPATDDSKAVEVSLPVDEQEDEFFDAPAEQLIAEPKAEEADTDTIVDVLVETPASEESLLTTKGRKSQARETETEDQPSLVTPEDRGLEEPSLPATNEESFVIDDLIPTHEDTTLERETPSAAFKDPSSVSKKGKKKKGKKSISWDEEEAIIAPSLEAITQAEHLPPNDVLETTHPLEANPPEHSSEHSQSSHVEIEAVPSGSNEDTSEETIQAVPSVEEWPSVTSKKSKKKKKGKASQVSEPEPEPEPEPLVEPEAKADEQTAEEARQSEAQLHSSQTLDESGNVVEAVSLEETPKASAESSLDAAAEVVESCPPVLSDEINQKPEPAFEAPQPPNDIVESTIAGVEPTSEEKKLDVQDSERDPPIQANEPSSEQLEIHPADASQSPGPDDVDKSLMKPNTLGGVETEQGPAPTDAAKDPPTESPSKDLHGTSAQSLETVEPPDSLLGTVSEAQISPPDQLTGGEPEKVMDSSEEPRSKKKGKKNKKKQQTALDLSDVQETVPTLPEIELVRDQPVEDAVSTERAIDDVLSLDDAATHQEQAESPNNDIWPDTVGSSRVSKKGKKGKKNLTGPDVSAAEGVIESSKPEEVVTLDSQDVDSEKSVGTSQVEPNTDDFWAESTTSASVKKGKKKEKKNRQTADSTARIEDNESSRVETESSVIESSADAVQQEFEPSPLSAAEANLPAEEEIPGAEPEVEVVPDKKKSKKDKKKRGSSQFDPSSNDTISEIPDTSSEQQDADAVMPLSGAADPSTDLVVDNTDPDTTKALDNTEDPWPTSKKSKKNKKRQSQLLTESEDASVLSSANLEAASDLKANSDTPEQEQVKEDDDDFSFTSTSTKKSKKDKKKKRQSVQFAEPIEESREIPAEPAGEIAPPELTTEPDEVSSDTPPEPTTPAEPTSLPLDAPDSLDQTRNGDALQDSIETPPVDLDSSTVSLLTDEEPNDLSREELRDAAPPSIRLEDEHVVSEQQENKEMAIADQIIDLQPQDDINNPVHAQPQGETEALKPVDNQTEAIGSNTTFVAPVEAVDSIPSDEQLPAETTPVTEHPIPAAAEEEFPLVGKKSKKEKKKRKGKAQDNQESAFDSPTLAAAIEAENPVEKNTETISVPLPNEPEVERDEPVKSEEQVAVEEAALDDEFPDITTKKGKKDKKKGKKSSKVLEVVPTLPSDVSPSLTLDSETRGQENLVDVPQSTEEEIPQARVEASDTPKLSVDDQETPLEKPPVVPASTPSDDQGQPSQDNEATGAPAIVQPENESVSFAEPTADALNIEESAASVTPEPEQSLGAEASKEQSSEFTIGHKSKKDKKKKKRDSQLTADQSDATQSAGTEPTSDVQIPATEVQETTTEALPEMFEGQAVPAQHVEETISEPLPEISESMAVSSQHVEDSAQEMDPSHREVELTSLAPTTPIDVEESIDLLKVSEPSSDQLPIADEAAAEDVEWASSKKSKKDKKKKKKQASPWDDELFPPSAPEQEEQAAEALAPHQTNSATEHGIVVPLEESKEDDGTDSAPTKKTKNDKKKKKPANLLDEEAPAEPQLEPVQAEPDNSEQNNANFSTELENSPAEVLPNVEDASQAVEAVNTEETFTSAPTKKSKKDKKKKKQTASWEDVSLDDNQNPADPVPAEVESSDIVTTESAEVLEDKDFMVDSAPMDEGVTQDETVPNPVPDSPPLDDLAPTKKSKKDKKKKKKATSLEEEVNLEDNQNTADPVTPEVEQPDIVATRSTEIPQDKDIMVSSTFTDEVAIQDETVPKDDSAPKDDKAAADDSAHQHVIIPENEGATKSESALQEKPVPDSQPLDDLAPTKKSKTDKKNKKQNSSWEDDLPQEDAAEGAIEATTVDLAESIERETPVQEPAHDESFIDPAPTKKGKKDKKKKKQSNSWEGELPQDSPAEETAEVAAVDPAETAEKETSVQEHANNDSFTDFATTKKSKKDKKKKKQSSSWTDELPEEIPTEDTIPTAAADVTEPVDELPEETPIEDSIPIAAAGLAELGEDNSPVLEPSNDDALADFVPGKKNKKDKKKKKGISWDEEILEEKLTETSVAPEAGNVSNPVVNETPEPEPSAPEPSAPEPSAPEPSILEPSTPEPSILEPSTLESSTLEPSNNDGFAESTAAKKSKKEKKKKKSISWDDEIPEEKQVEDAAADMTYPLVNESPASEPSNDDFAVSAPTKKSKKDKRKKDISWNDEVAEEKPTEDLAAVVVSDLTDPVVTEPVVPESVAPELPTSEPSNDNGFVELASTKKSKKDKKKKKKASSWEDEIPQEELPKEESTPQEEPLLENTPKEESPELVPPQEELPQAEASEVAQDTLALEELGQVTLPQEMGTEASAEPTSVFESGEPDNDEATRLDVPPDDEPTGSAPAKKSKKDKKKKKQASSQEVDYTAQEEAIQLEETHPTAETDTILGGGLPTEGETPAAAVPADTKEDNLDEFTDFGPTKKSKKDKKKKKQADSWEVDSAPQEESMQHEESLPPASEGQPHAEAETIPGVDLPTEGEAPAAAMPDDVKEDDSADFAPTKKSKKDKKKKKQALLEADLAEEPSEASVDATPAVVSDRSEQAEVEVTLPDAAGETETIEFPSTRKAKKDKKKKKASLWEDETVSQLEPNQESSVSTEVPVASEQASMEPSVTVEASQSEELSESTSGKRSKKDKKKKRANTWDFEPEPEVQIEGHPKVAAEPVEASEPTEVNSSSLPAEQSSVQVMDEKDVVSQETGNLSQEEVAGTPRHLDASAPVSESAFTEDMTPSTKLDDTKDSYIQPEVDSILAEAAPEDATQNIFSEETQATPQSAKDELSHEEVAPETGQVTDSDSRPPLQGPETVQLEEAAPNVVDEVDTASSKKSKKDKKKKKRASQVSWEPEPEAEIGDIPEQQQSEKAFDEQPMISGPTEMGNSAEAVEDPFSEFASGKKSKKKKRQSQMDWEPEPNSETPFEEPEPLPPTGQGQNSDMLLDHQSLAEGTETSLKDSTDFNDTFLDTTSSKKSKKKKKKASQLDWEVEPATTATSESAADSLLVEQPATEKSLEPIDAPSAEVTGTNPEDGESSENIFPEIVSTKKSKTEKRKTKKQAAAKHFEPEIGPALPTENEPATGDSIPRQMEPEASEKLTPADNTSSSLDNSDLLDRKDVAEEQSRDIPAKEVEPPLDQAESTEGLGQVQPIVPDAKESNTGMEHAEPTHNESPDRQDAAILPYKLEEASNEMALETQTEVMDESSQDQLPGFPGFTAKKSKKDKKKAKKAQAFEVADTDHGVDSSTNLQSWDWSNIDSETQPEITVPEGVSAPEDSTQVEPPETAEPSDAPEIASQQKQKEASNDDEVDSNKPALSEPEPEQFPMTRKKSKKDKKKKKGANQSESEPVSGVQTPLAQDIEIGNVLQDAVPLDPVIQEADAREPQDDEWASFGKKQPKKDKKHRKVLSLEEPPQEPPMILDTSRELEDSKQPTLDVISEAENQSSDARSLPEADKSLQLQEQVGVTDDAVPGNRMDVPELAETSKPTVSDSRPQTPPPNQQMSVNVDMSPAQLSSHIEHDRPFDQSTQPGKKVRTHLAEDDAMIPEPLSVIATEPPAPTPEGSDSQIVDAMAADMPLISEDSIEQAEKGGISDHMAQYTAVSYPKSDPLTVDDLQATLNHEEFQDSSLTQTSDRAVPAEFAPNKSDKKKKKKGQVDENQGVDTATIVGAGGVAQIAEKFGGSKKGKGKKKSKYVDKRTPTEDDIFDHPALWENSEPKALEEGSRLDADSGDFWTGPSTEVEGQPDEETQEMMDPAASEEVPRSTEHRDVGAEDYIESPVKGREIVPDLSRTYDMEETVAQLKETSMAEVQDSWDDLDTSEQPEGHHHKYLHEGARDAPEESFLPSLPPPRTPSVLDYGHVSPRSLPPVEEETHEDLEKELQTGLQAKTRMELEANRDSGVITDPPNPQRRSLGLEDAAGQRDSGVHMRGWTETTPRHGEEAAGSKESSTRAAFSSPVDEGSNAQTPQPSERRSRRSLFDSETPKLSTPTQGRGWDRDITPEKPVEDEPLKRAMTPLKSRAAKYQELASSSSAGAALHTPQHQTQRSVSDNISDINRETTPRLESEARRSASNTGISRLQTPEPLKFRPESPGSHSIRSIHSIHSIRSLRSSGANTPPLRRVGRQVSGDLRSLSHNQPSATGSTSSLPIPTKDAKDSKDSARDASDRHALHTTTTPIANEGRVRAKDMTDVYDGYGEGRIGSPRSPTRPPSMRRRQSMQVLELESKVEQLLAENRALADARVQDQRSLNQRNTSAITDRDAEIESLKASLQWLQNEVTRLTEVNEGLQSANSLLAIQHNEKYSRLESQHTTAARELEEHRGARGQYTQTLQEKDAEIQDLRNQLEATKEQIREMQKQILATKPPDAEFLRLKDEDHFDHRCQQLCSHVQQWVLRFSKFSDMRACRLTSEINDEKIIDRLDNTVLDGSDVDDYLSDRVRRRDIFMSMTMNMIWEFVFTRYLFGMDREQRQKLKSLEKLLTEVGPPQAVRQWRAVTLTLLSKRPAFGDQRNQDTEAVVQAILQTLSMILPPPSNLETQIQSQLRRVMREAVDLSIEMRTQRAEYMMLPPLQPEYDANGELKQTVTFNAALMNERSGDPSTTNEAYEAQGAIVRCVLFPLVVKKGDDNGVGDDEIVVSPAQVLVAKARHSTTRMVTPSSDAGGVPLSRGATPSIYGQSTMSVNMQDTPLTPDYI